MGRVTSARERAEAKRRANEGLLPVVAVEPCTGCDDKKKVKEVKAKVEIVKMGGDDEMKKDKTQEVEL